MPIYEYACQDCGNQFEKLVLRLTEDAPAPACPGCGRSNSRRIMSTVSTPRTGSGTMGNSCAPAGSTGFS